MAVCKTRGEGGGRSWVVCEDAEEKWWGRGQMGYLPWPYCVILKKVTLFKDAVSYYVFSAFGHHPSTCASFQVPFLPLFSWNTRYCEFQTGSKGRARNSGGLILRVYSEFLCCCNARTDHLSFNIFQQYCLYCAKVLAHLIDVGSATVW